VADPLVALWVVPEERRRENLGFLRENRRQTEEEY